VSCCVPLRRSQQEVEHRSTPVRREVMVLSVELAEDAEVLPCSSGNACWCAHTAAGPVSQSEALRLCRDGIWVSRDRSTSLGVRVASSERFHVLPSDFTCCRSRFQATRALLTLEISLHRKGASAAGRAQQAKHLCLGPALADGKRECSARRRADLC
jgi:hypothetical protein